MMQRFEREEIDLPKNLRRVIPHIYTPSTIPTKQLRLLGRDEHFLQHLEHCPKCSSSISSVTLYLIFLVFVVCECLCYVCLLYYILYTELHYLSSHFFFFESRCLKMFLQDMPSQVFCQYVVPFQEVGSPKSRQPFAQGQVVVVEEEEEEEDEEDDDDDEEEEEAGKEEEDDEEDDDEEDDDDEEEEEEAGKEVTAEEEAQDNDQRCPPAVPNKHKRNYGEDSEQDVAIVATFKAIVRSFLKKVHVSPSIFLYFFGSSS
jgi:hypothetical protein